MSDLNHATGVHKGEESKERAAIAKAGARRLSRLTRQESNIESYLKIGGETAEREEVMAGVATPERE